MKLKAPTQIRKNRLQISWCFLRKQQIKPLLKAPLIFTSPNQRPNIRSLITIQGNKMTCQVLTDVATSISELKANPMKVVASGGGLPIVVLNRNEPAFYCVPAAAYEAMMELIDDMELLKIVQNRLSEESVAVSLDEL